jgi:hypothetical protein
MIWFQPVPLVPQKNLSDQISDWKGRAKNFD